MVFWDSSGLFHEYEAVDGSHGTSNAIDQEKPALYGVVKDQGSSWHKKSPEPHDKCIDSGCLVIADFRQIHPDDRAGSKLEASNVNNGQHIQQWIALDNLLEEPHANNSDGTDDHSDEHKRSSTEVAEHDWATQTCNDTSPVDHTRNFSRTQGTTIEQLTREENYRINARQLLDAN